MGIEPTSTELKVRCITLSATIPFVFDFQSARKESNLRPSSYKDAARTIELHAEQVRPVGFEPTLCAYSQVNGFVKRTMPKFAR